MSTRPRILAFFCCLSVFLSNVGASETAKNDLEEIILVFKTHFDIGYTKLASEVIEDYRTAMIDNALAVVDASAGQPEDRKFIWTLPGWPLAKILESQTPERASRLEKAIRQGRFVVHALPFTTHTETLVEEDLVRGLRFADRINRQFGFDPPTAAKMTDVPCHSWFLPTFLAHSGITFMHEGTNSGSSDPVVPLLYFREGPDGSQVLTMHVDGYGTGVDPPKDWPYRTWLGLIHTGDNHGPPKPDEIGLLFDYAAQNYPGVKVRIGKLEDFANAILEKEDALTIPVVRGDMPDTWIHGPMCDPQGQKLARSVHERLSYDEILGTLLAIRSGTLDDSEAAKRIAAAREQSLLYGEHTWGAALYWMSNYGQGQSLPFGEQWQTLFASQNFTNQQKRAMASWEEHTDYIRNAAKLLSDDAAHAPGNCFFNPLPWDVAHYSGTTLPACGVETIRFAEPTNRVINAPSDDVELQSPWFRITVDGKTGRIKSLRDLKHDRELLSSAPSSTGFLYQRASAEMCDRFVDDYAISRPNWVISEFGKQGLPRDVPEKRISPERVDFFSVSTSDSQRTLSIRYANAPDLPFESLTLNLTLYEHRPEIRFHFEGKGKRPDTWPEAGYFHFPFNIDEPRFRLGRLGGIVDPVTQIVPGSNRHLLWLRSGMAVFGRDGYGLGICPLDTPLVSLGEPGGWKFSKDYVPKSADVYFNLFNNQWTTNFRLWNEGDISASFALWTFENYDNESSLVTPSLESLALNNLPSLSCDDFADDFQGITVDRKGFYITAFGKDTDSGKLIVRLWEMVGQNEENQTVEITFPVKLKVKAVIPCDLRNRSTTEAIPAINNKVTIKFKPYAPINLVVEHD